MQQQSIPSPNGEQTQEPEWELATYARRMGAWALDFVGFALPLILLIAIALILGFVLLFAVADERTSDSDSSGRKIMKELAPDAVTGLGERPFWDDVAGALTIMLFLIFLPLIVLFGYITWWLFALRHGQTPGKQIVGIRVIKDNGEPSGWGYTFLREFVLKFLLLNLLSEPTFGIARLVDYLWPLWDRAEKMQTLHDKMLGTIVVRNR